MNMYKMGQRGTYDWSFGEIINEGGLELWDMVQELGLDEALARWIEGKNGNGTDWWTKNKKWVIPVGIGSGVLLTVVAFIRTRKK